MIFLFDNCYLSTTNTIVEDCKHVWIGKHANTDDSHCDYSFDIYKKLDDVNAAQLDELYEDIHLNLSDKKVIIYVDNDYFTYVYYHFFRGYLSKAAVDEMFKFDIDKENFGLGSSVYGLYVTGTKAIDRIELVEGSKPRTFSKYSGTLNQQRIEIAFANALLGDKKAMKFCVERATQMWDGTPGFRAKYAEQTLPALLTDEQYTIDNITSEKFVEDFLASFNVDEFIPVNVLPKIKEIFDFDYLDHFFNVVNENGFENKEYIELMWTPSSEMTKAEFIESFLLNPKNPVKSELLFPSISNFDSLNPIFWNAVFRHYNDTSWLSKYGINNQTDGTV